MEDLQHETDSEAEDCGGEEWDPHASMKPSLIDAELSDKCWDPEDNPDKVENEAFHALMVEMLLDLGDDDLQDCEWKPKHKKRKKTVTNGQFTTIHCMHVC